MNKFLTASSASSTTSTPAPIRIAKYLYDADGNPLNINTVTLNNEFWSTFEIGAQIYETEDAGSSAPNLTSITYINDQNFVFEIDNTTTIIKIGEWRSSPVAGTTYFEGYDSCLDFFEDGSLSTSKFWQGSQTNKFYFDIHCFPETAVTSGEYFLYPNVLEFTSGQLTTVSRACPYRYYKYDSCTNAQTEYEGTTVYALTEIANWTTTGDTIVYSDIACTSPITEATFYINIPTEYIVKKIVTNTVGEVVEYVTSCLAYALVHRTFDSYFLGGPGAIEIWANDPYNEGFGIGTQVFTDIEFSQPVTDGYCITSEAWYFVEFGGFITDMGATPFQLNVYSDCTYIPDNMLVYGSSASPTIDDQIFSTLTPYPMLPYTSNTFVYGGTIFVTDSEGTIVDSTPCET